MQSKNPEFSTAVYELSDSVSSSIALVTLGNTDFAGDKLV